MQSYLKISFFTVYLYTCPCLAYNGPRPDGTKSYNQVLYVIDLIVMTDKKFGRNLEFSAATFVRVLLNKSPMASDG